MITKSLFNFAQDIIRNQGQGGFKKRGVQAETLYHDYGVGELQTNKLVFTLSDIEKLKTEFKRLHHLDLLSPYPEATTRKQTAENQRNEKANAQPVTQDFVLVNAINELQLNNTHQPINSINSLGVYLNSNHIQSIEHNTIVLVENLTLMAALKQLTLPAELQDALWLYRGDIKSQQSTGTAYSFFRRWQTNPRKKLVCFADFDPKGLEIVATSGAHYWLSPSPAQWETMLTLSLSGVESEWHNQHAAKVWLKKNHALPTFLQAAFTTMQQHQTTFKQEHMLSHHIPLTLLALNANIIDT